MTTHWKSRLRVFCTSPQSMNTPQNQYVSRVAEVSRWAERYGCEGILIYTDNGLVDPWLVSNVVIQNTDRLCPLVAVQPAYMHPYTAAKMIASFGFLNERRLYVNMVAGGFRNDLLALNDDTPHDARYDRVTEYTLILKQLLASSKGVTFQGQYYTVNNLRMKPPLDPELMPGILISGSSDAGLEAAQKIGATAIKYPGRPDDEQQLEPPSDLDQGIRVGIVARETTAEAWEVAHNRFPTDARGEKLHDLAMKTSDSSWHKQLSEMAAADAAKDDPYWLRPFKTYKTFCPYLVGSYETVAREFTKYITAGYGTYIMDIPPTEDELQHMSIVFDEAIEGVSQCQN